MAYLFVYGTLKRGGSRHSLLKGCPFLGHALARALPFMTSAPTLGWFPEMG
jgi:gamma-glutamylcyclotransferase (GGCT)/AIG2-like uncharacterized protein YtfP